MTHRSVLNLTLVGLLPAILLGNVCSVVKTAPSFKPSLVVVEGILIFGRHAAYITEPGQQAGSAECTIFTVFSGTPRFMLPGLDSEKITSSPALDFFVSDYRNRADRGQKSERVRIRGRVIAKKDFSRTAKGRADGYGYQGLFKVALLVDEVLVLANPPLRSH